MGTKAFISKLVSRSRFNIETGSGWFASVWLRFCCCGWIAGGCSVNGLRSGLRVCGVVCCGGAVAAKLWVICDVMLFGVVGPV
jgi:hypothetical protein